MHEIRNHFQSTSWRAAIKPKSKATQARRKKGGSQTVSKKKKARRTKKGNTGPKAPLHNGELVASEGPISGCSEMTFLGERYWRGGEPRLHSLKGDESGNCRAGEFPGAVGKKAGGEKWFVGTNLRAPFRLVKKDFSRVGGGRGV